MTFVRQKPQLMSIESIHIYTDDNRLAAGPVARSDPAVQPRRRTSERQRIVGRILSLPEAAVLPLLNQVLAEFSSRHPNIGEVFLDRFQQIRNLLPLDGELSESRKRLIGSYFVSEFSLESAALFNPSIVPHPDQSGVPPNGLRFILSLRATGEGHLSSITFRTGMIHPDGRIEVMERGRLSQRTAPDPQPAIRKGSLRAETAGTRTDQLNLPAGPSARSDRTFDLDELR